MKKKTGNTDYGNACPCCNTLNSKPKLISLSVLNSCAFAVIYHNV